MHILVMCHTEIYIYDIVFCLYTNESKTLCYHRFCFRRCKQDEILYLPLQIFILYMKYIISVYLFVIFKQTHFTNHHYSIFALLIQS